MARECCALRRRLLPLLLLLLLLCARAWCASVGADGALEEGEGREAGRKHPVQLAVSAAALAYLNSSLIDAAHSLVGPLALPGICDTAKTPVGIVDFNVTEVIVSNVRVLSSNVDLLPLRTISFELNNVSADVSFKWSYRKRNFVHVSDAGSGFMQLNETTVRLLATFMEDSAVRLIFHDAEVHVGGVAMTFSGGASWFYNFVLALFAPWLSRNFERSAQAALVKSANSIAERGLGMAQEHVSLPGVKRVLFDPALADPRVRRDAISLFSDARFLVDGHECTCNASESGASFPPPPHGGPAPEPKMFRLIVSQAVACSAARALYEGHGLNMSMSQDELPPDYRVFLNTSFFRLLLPQLYHTYPNRAIVISVWADEPPNITFCEGGAAATGRATFVLSVVLDEGEHKTAFALGTSFRGGATARLSPGGHNITASLRCDELHLTLLETSIGSLDVALLTSEATYLVRALLEFANTGPLSGMPLPALPAGVVLAGEALVWGDSWVELSTNVTVDWARRVPQ
eukprot:TRINITY_DN5055_c1_g1_i1.p1 TRINITY_DN5055_c1_g1~~TRINITY_DN5055_c1_g1_i1.p1  ORF type:complete len:539 (-),score=126.91 TRINITY_DN5055_c1_g1_i1:1396-2949(-)